MDEDGIYLRLRDNLATVLTDVAPGELTLDRTLAELGCNSVDRAEVVTMTMEDLGITVPVMEFQDVKDVRSLVELFGKYAP